MGKKKKEKKVSAVCKPTVSICTPTFNRREFIPQLIQCVKNQTYPKQLIEWIVVDDGEDSVEELFRDINFVTMKYFRILYHLKCLIRSFRSIFKKLSCWIRSFRSIFKQILALSDNSDPSLKIFHAESDHSDPSLKIFLAESDHSDQICRLKPQICKISVSLSVSSRA